MKDKQKRRLLRILGVEVIMLILFAAFLGVSEMNVSRSRQEAVVESRLNRISDAILREVDRTEYDETLLVESNQRLMNSFLYMSYNDERFATTPEYMASRARLLGVQMTGAVTSSGKELASNVPTGLQRDDYVSLVEAAKSSGNGIGTRVINGISYYAGQGADDIFYVIGIPAEDYEAIRQEQFARNRVLAQTIRSDNLFLIIQDGTVIFHNGGEYTGKTMAELQLNELQDGHHAQWVTVGIPYYAGMKYIDDLDVSMVYGIRRNSVMNGRMVIILCMALLAICAAGLSFYVYYARRKRLEDKMDEGSQYSRKAVQKRGAAAGSVIIVLMLCASYFLQSLFGLSIHTMDDQEDLNIARMMLAQSEVAARETMDQYDSIYLRRAQIIAGILSDNTNLRTREQLRKLSGIFDVEYIMMFDREGRETLSDSSYVGFSISNDENDQSHAFANMRYGVPYIIQPAAVDELSGQYHQFIAVQTFDEQGNNDGFLQIAIVPERLQTALESCSISSVLRQTLIGQTDTFFAVESSTGRIAYAADPLLIGEEAKMHGFTVPLEDENYFDYAYVDGVKYFMSGTVIGDYNVYVGSPCEEIYAGRDQFTLDVGLFTFIFILILTLTLYEIENEAENEPVKPQVFIDKTADPDKELSPFRKHWKYLSPEQKTTELLRFMTIFTVLGLCVYLFYVPYDRQVFRYLLGSGWKRGLNIFAATAAGFTCLIVITAVSIVCHILRAFSRIVNPRHATLLLMIHNFIGYVAGVCIIYRTLYLLGVNSTTLALSAVILAVVIGLGSKDLVTDIIAGLFIIFEGEFHVGDVVEIEGYRGTVQEIGLRTTKLIGAGQNIKVISNRNVTNVINMTEQNSYVSVSATVGYSVSIDALEDIFKRELPALRVKYDEFETDPFFYGVNSLSGSGMTFIIRAECSEKDIEHMEVVLTKEVKSILDRYDIRMR